MYDLDFGNYDSIRFPSWKCWKIFACHGLTSDQDMQRVSDILGCLPYIPKSTLHATVWPQTRTCKGSWKFGLPALKSKSTLHVTVWPQTRTCKRSWKFGLQTLNSQKYFACHGLTQTRTCKGSWNFGLHTLPAQKIRKVLCIAGHVYPYPKHH